MSRSRSPIRASGERASRKAVTITPVDIQRLSLLGRWYCLSADAIARSETDPKLWSPNEPFSQTEEGRDQFAKRVYAVRRRLTRLKHLESNPGLHVGPMVDNALVHEGLIAWFATRIGGTHASLPWTLRNSISPMFAAHSWMAADIGMALESDGYTVLSERELATGINRHGFRIEAPLESKYVASNGMETGKKPDVAVLHPNGHDYIAIEVERDTDRSVKTYEQKLRAYRSNSAVKAVWYICASNTTARRVGKGAQKALGKAGSFPLRIVTNEPTNGFHFLDMQNLQSKLVEDLRPMKTETENA